MRAFKHAFLFFVLSALFATSRGQIVHVSNDVSETDKAGWHGNVSLNLTYRKNPNEILTYGNKSMLQWVKKRNSVLVLTDLNRITASGSDFDNSGFAHVRYNYRLNEAKTIFAEAFNQVQFNSQQLLQLRVLSGAGISWRPLERDSLKIRVGTIPMFEYEELSTNIIERNFRESTYILFFFRTKNVEFQTINYYQPRINDFGDFRLSTSNILKFDINKWFTYNVTFDLQYDSRPAVTIPKSNMIVSNGLGIRF